MSKKSAKTQRASKGPSKTSSGGARVWPAVRVIIGLVFVVSGFEKLIGPYQNFQYIIEQYGVVNSQQAAVVAQLLPWAELIAGAFFMLGLYTYLSGAAIMSLSGLFLGVVGQALARRLPMDECGCFGKLISIPLPAVFVMDLAFVLLTFLGLRKQPGMRVLSIDAAYERA